MSRKLDEAGGAECCSRGQYLATLSAYTKSCERFISFYKSTEIPMSLIFFSKDKFVIPPTIKRVMYYTPREGEEFEDNRPIVTIDGENPFVSVVGKRNIMNHYPLEIVFHDLYQTRVFIKETSRIIGNLAFGGNIRIKSVAFPPSVEIIADQSFAGCTNLTQITFRGKSNLRIIGESAFCCTSIHHIDFPSSLEEIVSYAFFFCKKLSSVSFPEDSKLKRVGTQAFQVTNIQEIKFPSGCLHLYD